MVERWTSKTCLNSHGSVDAQGYPKAAGSSPALGARFCFCGCFRHFCNSHRDCCLPEERHLSRHVPPPLLRPADPDCGLTARWGSIRFPALLLKIAHPQPDGCTLVASCSHKRGCADEAQPGNLSGAIGAIILRLALLCHFCILGSPKWRHSQRQPGHHHGSLSSAPGLWDNPPGLAGLASPQW